LARGVGLKPFLQGGKAARMYRYRHRFCTMNRSPFCVICQAFTELEDAGDSAHPRCAECHHRMIEWRTQPETRRVRFLYPDESRLLFEKLRNSIS
jgi:hypothetical protein